MIDGVKGKDKESAGSERGCINENILTRMMMMMTMMMHFLMVQIVDTIWL